jgi:hypothetical protein
MICSNGVCVLYPLAVSQQTGLRNSTPHKVTMLENLDHFFDIFNIEEWDIAKMKPWEIAWQRVGELLLAFASVFKPKFSSLEEWTTVIATKSSAKRHGILVSDLPFWKHVTVQATRASCTALVKALEKFTNNTSPLWPVLYHNPSEVENIHENWVFKCLNDVKNGVSIKNFDDIIKLSSDVMHRTFYAPFFRVGCDAVR